MKSNILLVGLNYEFLKDVCKIIADCFDMFFLDVKDLIEYSLVDSQKVKNICGSDFYQKEELKIALSVAEYEKSVINFPYELCLSADVLKRVSETCLIVYVTSPKSLLKQQNNNKGEVNSLDLELIAFEELNTFLKEHSDIVVENNKDDANLCSEEVLKQMKSRLIK